VDHLNLFLDHKDRHVFLNLTREKIIDSKFRKLDWKTEIDPKYIYGINKVINSKFKVDLINHTFLKDINNQI